MHLRSTLGKRLLSAGYKYPTFGASGSEGMGNPQSFTGIAPSPALCEILLQFPSSSTPFDSKSSNLYALTQHTRVTLHTNASGFRLGRERIKGFAYRFTPAIGSLQMLLALSILRHSFYFCYLIQGDMHHHTQETLKIS